ncbi:hypothetical protein EYF80_049917 [Liparis tanakae]|uniref:Uncharacterized protein n=1 Tax=Liparis tanakae TaxID=230148 RepID=A0A4Z2FFJ3_9TELE|nr:hypothetical protein EYF80_049917 [Liparis tanakae]
MIQVRRFFSPGSVFTGSASTASNSRHRDTAVLLSLPEGRRQEPAEELQQQEAIVGRLQRGGEIVGPGRH